MKSRALLVTVMALILTTACNKEEFYGTSVAIEGADSSCGAGTDISSCEAISGCQVALEDVESVEPVFAACIANPDTGPEVVILDPPDNTDPNPTVPPASPVLPDLPAPEVVEEVPTIDEAYANKCANLAEKYFYVKNYSGEGGSKKSKKVKICHQSSKGEHAIIVACPALKAHRKHADYLGACKVD
jgi:hypothetical protein